MVTLVWYAALTPDGEVMWSLTALLWLLALMPTVTALYLGWLMFETWYETKHIRRVDMFICDKHGMLPKESTINLSTYMGTNYEMCSICYKKRLQNNGR